MPSLSQAAAAKNLTVDDVAQLRRAPLFRRLNEDALARLIGSAAPTKVQRGQTLFVQGEEAIRFFVLLAGWIKLYRTTAEGAEAVVTIVAPGESFAEAALFVSSRYPVSAEAVDNARLLAFSAPAFERLMAEESGLAMAMLASLSVRLRGLVSHIEQLHTHSAPVRVGSFFLRLCGSAVAGEKVVTLPFDKALIAKRLGMQPETFSRALRQLRTIGVHSTGASITVGDVAALRSYCGDVPEDP